jgi:F-box and WD-40 domain protein CDC4
METSKCTHIFVGHTSTVRCLQIIEPVNINPDQDGAPIWEPPYPLIVTGSRDSTLRVWKLPMPGVDSDYIPFAPISPDGNLLGDYIADNPYHIRVLAGHKNAVRALSGAGRVVVSGSYDNTIRVWDILSGECTQILRGHAEKVYSVVYDAQRQQCASGSMDGSVKLWSTKTGQCLRSLEGHTSLVGLLGLSRQHLVSAAADSTLRVWDASNGKCKHILSAHSGAITCFQHDDHKVVSGSDGTLKMWDVWTGAYIRDLLVHLSGVWQVGFNDRFCVAAVQRNGLSEYDSALAISPSV